MTSIKKKLFMATSLFMTSTYGLVDYTEKEAFVPQASGAASVTKKAPTPRTVTRPKKSNGQSGPVGISVGTSYGLHDVEVGQASGKVDILGIDAHFQTHYNIFMNVSYYQAKSSNPQLVTDNTSFQEGNPEVILGFNWLQFGKKAELATIDLYGGLSVGQKNSSFATERTDKIVGVSTAKRFYSFALGIGYEHRLTGTGGSEEMIIGDITKLSASLGWVVSKDIRFLIEGTTLNIREGENNFIQSFLDEKVTFGSIKPQLQLRVGRSIDFTLGAQFRTKRISREELTLARFWSLDGAYGNSVFSGLSFSI